MAVGEQDMGETEATLDNYLNYLKKGNTLESSNPEQSFENLMVCVDLYDKIENMPEDRRYDKIILLRRVEYLEKLHEFRSNLAIEDEIAQARSQAVSKPITEPPVSKPIQSSDSQVQMESSDVSDMGDTGDMESKGSSGTNEGVNEDVMDFLGGLGGGPSDSEGGADAVETGEAVEIADAVGCSDAVGGIEAIPSALEVPEIINTVFDKLMHKEYPSYEEYLEFYREVNRIIPSRLGPIVQNHTPMSYFVGDTHGSWDESIVMIQYFEKVLSRFSQATITFVGDYVDRNPFDLENLTVIVGFYLRNMSNVILLRGNHEDKVINETYGFIRNMMDSLIIPERVQTLYREILTFFTHLPIALINELRDEQNNNNIRIFAAHGGIPINQNDPSQPVNILKIQEEINSDAESYEQMNKYMTWLLWADPKENLQGFLDDPITGRSQFGLDAYDQFLEENNFQYMVRAHEKWSDGYRFFFNERLVSLFSTSYYSGKKVGDGAFLRLEPGKAPCILRPHSDQLNEDLKNL